MGDLPSRPRAAPQRVHSADVVLLAAADAVANSTIGVFVTHGFQQVSDIATISHADEIRLGNADSLLAPDRSRLIQLWRPAVVAGIRLTSLTLAALTFKASPSP